MFHDALENASWAGQSEGSLYHSTVGQQPSLRGSSLQSEAAFSLGSVYLVSESPAARPPPPKTCRVEHVCGPRVLPGL